jgi:hypothetical protein
MVGFFLFSWVGDGQKFCFSSVPADIRLEQTPGGDRRLMTIADSDPVVPYQYRRSSATFCSQPSKNLAGKFSMWMQQQEIFFSPKMAMTMHFRG